MKLMKYELKRVTPEMAKEFLKKNKINRPLSMKNISFLSREIEEGRWQITHQGICLSEDGELIDGQHRLHAIIKTGIPVDIQVTTGLDKNIFKVVDVGKKRNAADVLAIEGFTYSNQVPGLGYKMIKWNNRDLITRSSDGINIDYLIDFARANETDIYDAIKEGMSAKQKIYLKSIAIFMYWLLNRIDPSLTHYMDHILDGATTDNNILKFRSDLIDFSIQRVSIHEHKLVTDTLNVILCCVKGKKWTKIKEIEPEMAYQFADELSVKKVKKQSKQG